MLISCRCVKVIFAKCRRIQILSGVFGNLYSMGNWFGKKHHTSPVKRKAPPVTERDKAILVSEQICECCVNLIFQPVMSVLFWKQTTYST